MNSITDRSNISTLTIPLTRSSRQLAEEFARQQSTSKKAKKVYLNTLAVCAVDFYLQCLEIATDRSAGDSWHPVKQGFGDVADLTVKERGKLECIPVLPSDEIVEISPEVFENRIGYVFVMISESLREVTLLGFMKKVTEEEVSLAQLSPLEDLLAHLESLGQPQADETLVQLSQWFEGIISETWQAVETLLGSNLNLAYRSRSSNKNSVKRVKLIDLGQQGNKEPVALIVGVTPTDEPEMDICVDVYPTGESIYLPPQLQLIVLDEEGTAVIEAQAKSTKNFQLDFTGEPGERFSVKLALANVSITEAFLI